MKIPSFPYIVSSLPKLNMSCLLLLKRKREDYLVMAPLENVKISRRSKLRYNKTEKN